MPLEVFHSCYSISENLIKKEQGKTEYFNCPKSLVWEPSYTSVYTLTLISLRLQPFTDLFLGKCKKCDNKCIMKSTYFIFIPIINFPNLIKMACDPIKSQTYSRYLIDVHVS